VFQNFARGHYNHFAPSDFETHWNQQMKFRLQLSVFSLLVSLSLSIAAQTSPQYQTRLRAALARDDLATVESTLREIARTAPEAFTRENYDYLLARVLARRGETAEAKRLFQGIVARRSILSAYALWHQAELARAADNPAEEQQLLSRLVSEHPQYLRRETALARLGASYLRSKKYQNAITTLRSLAGTRGNLARESQARIGEAQLALGDRAGARSIFDSLLAGGATDDGSLRAINGLDRLDEIEKTSVSEGEHLRRARVYQFNRAFAEARRHWQAIVNNAPSVSRAEAIFQIGRGYFLEENYAEAIRWYERAHDEFPINEEGEQGFYYVGHAAQALGETDRAINRYEEFIKAYPQSKYYGYAYLNAIDTLRSADRLDEALRWTARTAAEVRDPFITGRALFDQAKIRMTQGNFTGALADIIALRSRNLGRGLVATTNYAELAFLRAYCLEKIGRYEEATAEYLALPEGREGSSGYYGYQASERLRALGIGTRTKRIVTAKLEGYLKEARAAHSAGNAMTAKAAASQALRLVDDRETREEMRRILRAAYAILPSYRLPSFQGVSLEGSESIAAELIALGLYDEGASELVASRPAGGGNWTYTLAMYCARGACADRTIKFSEPMLKAIPNDYRLELLPRELAEIFYPVPYREPLMQHAASRGVDPRFVLSIARQESRYDPRVKSNSAARGMLQFIASTSNQIAAQLRLTDFDQNDLYQPETAILIGAQYMKNLFDEFQMPQAVAAAYNGSEDSVRRWIARAKNPEVDRFVIEVAKSQTKDYVFYVLNNYRAYQALYPEFNLKKSAE
jgi:soluble lytic murein transglycosylase